MNDTVKLSLDDTEWEIDLHDLLGDDEPSRWERFKAFFGRIFKPNRKEEITQEDFPDEEERKEAYLDRCVKIMVAEKVEEALLMTAWEPRGADEEAPNFHTGVVTRVRVLELGDNEWTLLIDVAPRYTNDAAISVPLTEFFSSFVPTGPLTFKDHDA